MAARSGRDELGMTPQARELAARVFGSEPAATPPPAPRHTVPWTAIAIFALALAIVVHAMLFRYETTANGYMAVRTDRLTGRIVRCYTTAPVCQTPVVAPPVIPDPH